MNKFTVAVTILIVCAMFLNTAPLAAQAGDPPPTPPEEASEEATEQVAEEPEAPADDEDSPVLLNFADVDIYAVIRIIADALELNYVIDPSVAGTVNITTSESLRRSDLMPILETVLKINGATIIQTGNFYQIIPSSTAIREPLEIQDPPRGITPDDRIVMRVVRMKYVRAAEMSTLLSPYLGEAGNIVVHSSGNILLITERTRNLNKLLGIIDIFDSGVFEGERVRMFPVENAFPSDLIPDLRSIFAGYALSSTDSAIQFVAMERLNSILVVTPNPAVFPEVEMWVDRLDQPLQTGGVQNFVYRVKNSKAADRQRVLSQLYSTGGPIIPIATTGQAAVPNGQAAGPVAATPQPGGFTQADRALLGGIRIIADVVTNSLVIQTTPQEYAEIERALRELDILPRQVLIDAQIYEVVLDDSLALGVSATLQNRGTLAGIQGVSEPQTRASLTAGNLAVDTFAFVGRTRELVAFLTASENRSRVRTLSAPSVLVSDNMPARFEVGAEVPIPTTSSITPVQAEGTNLFAQEIQFRTTGVILAVTPQINESGWVTLKISQEVSQAGVNNTSDIVAPVIGIASVESTVVIQDGQTIALGGFIRESTERTRSGIPFLSRIPVLGALFGTTTRGTNRSELIILITPHVILTHEDADLATEELKQKLREVQKMMGSSDPR